ncbi:helix-turn-helix domain-containing protein [Actinophytocola sediminis]
MTQENTIGRRLREIRRARGLSLRAVAELAGFSGPYLSMIERGVRPIERRSTLEALAAALSIAPSELASMPWPPRDDAAAETRAAAGLVEAAVVDLRLDDPVEVTPRPWPALAAELRRLNTELRPHADYAAQGFLLPGLIRELHAVHATDDRNRTNALKGLAACYHAAAMMAKETGVRGVAQLAADRQVTVAERLGRPEWIAHAAWVRVQAIGGVGRERQVALTQRALAAVEGADQTPELIQAVGQLHLLTSLAYAAMGNEDDAWTHFGAAETLATQQEAEVGTFGYLWFGRTNVRFWKVALGTEFGYAGKVAELARGTRPELLPSPARQAEFYADLGRALAQDKRTRGEAVRLLRKAETLAPQLVHHKLFVRETVTDLLLRLQDDTARRQLRGLAHRIGLPS